MDRIVQTYFDIGTYWIPAQDGNLDAFHLYQRHYTYREYKDGRRNNPSNPCRRLIVGPGEKCVLIGRDGRALFVWRKFKDGSGQQGINCAVFRNEGPELSSDLIKEADRIAFKKWPEERHYTYVNGAKIKSVNPGYCFKMAGWRECGKTKGGLTILERLFL